MTDEYDSMMNLLQRTADKLVERGYATKHTLDLNKGFGSFEWTPKGEALHHAIQHFFDVPNTRPDQLDKDAMFALVWLLIMTEA